MTLIDFRATIIAGRKLSYWNIYSHLISVKYYIYTVKFREQKTAMSKMESWSRTSPLASKAPSPADIKA